MSEDGGLAYTISVHVYIIVPSNHCWTGYTEGSDIGIR